jgi:hypothetical protein
MKHHNPTLRVNASVVCYQATHRILPLSTLTFPPFSTLEIVLQVGYGVKYVHIIQVIGWTAQNFSRIFF